MHYGWPSPALPILLSPDSPIPITQEEGSLVATIQEYGNIVGDILAVFIVDKIGRKNSILLSAPLFFVGWLLIAETQSLAILYIVRFSAGVTDGLIYTALPMYLGEISHPNIRGLLGSVLQVSFVFGLLVYDILGSLVSLKIATYVAATIPILQLVTFAFMPESPYYLIMKEKNKEAERSLMKLNNGKMDDTLNEIIESVKDDKEKETAGILEIVKTKANRKALMITFGLRFFQQFTGISAINFYIQSIFVDADLGISASMVSIIYFLLQFVMCFAVTAIIDRTGRKPLLIFSLIGTGIADAVLAAYFFWSQGDDHSDSWMKFIPVVAILCYVVIFNVGLASTPMVFISELFNTRVKAVAICAADIYFSLLIVLVSTYFQRTKDSFGIHVPFISFTLFCFLGAVFVYYLVPETKGMTLEQIQDYLNSKERRKTTTDNRGIHLENLENTFNNKSMPLENLEDTPV